ncbi:hypothetical protein SR39_10690 [Methylobacterium radiotolerans]|jgi:hypothetical protein|nr:hypothetical protein SR39_10690 [Methylobacterium radiotolerans]
MWERPIEFRPLTSHPAVRLGSAVATQMQLSSVRLGTFCRSKQCRLQRSATKFEQASIEAL